MGKYLLLTSFVLISACLAQTGAQGKAERKELKPALIVIDIQERYLPMMAEEEKDLALRMINGAIWLFRQHDLPVIRVYHSDRQFGPKPGEEGFDFPSSIIIKDDDPKVIKNYPSAFTKTDLEKILRDKDVNTIFLCGLSAVGCVLATYHGGVDRGFETFMVKNAIMSHKSEYTKVVEDITENVSFKLLQFMLEHLPK
ncbi:MAG: isochorismatase family protein [candidate division WOR-3 bacterium]|nr:MAG: isochorismatase family protein [candidate division WOR-3 bacterium]